MKRQLIPITVGIALFGLICVAIMLFPKADQTVTTQHPGSPLEIVVTGPSVYYLNRGGRSSDDFLKAILAEEVEPPVLGMTVSVKNVSQSNLEMLYQGSDDFMRSDPTVHARQGRAFLRHLKYTPQKHMQFPPKGDTKARRISQRRIHDTLKFTYASGFSSLVLSRSRRVRDHL